MYFFNILSTQFFDVDQKLLKMCTNTKKKIQ